MTEAESSISSTQLIEFAQAFSKLAADAHSLIPATSEVADLVASHLGADPSTLPSVGQSLPAVERPNLQLALDEIVAAQPGASIIGLSPELGHYGGFSLAALLAGRFRGPGEPVPPAYDELPVGVDITLRCVVAGLWLVHHEGVPVVVGLAPGEQHGPPTERKPGLEVFAAEPDTAQSVLSLLADRRRALNVYRHKVLSFSHSEYGDFGITFMPRPQTAAAEVILPADDLRSIERHAIGIGQHADSLLSAGRHLKRGLLLFGPPGAGKTHTISYLMAAMPDRTTVVLQGPSVGALGYAAAIVRTLSPSMLVIEDVDLIATERGMYGMGHDNPLMFQLLNEMDGLTATDDVLFVLTTNRVDTLEPALVARPGRIDHAVEIKPPDLDGRERLLRLYLEGTNHDVGDLGGVVERSAGVTASFMKELVRRATFNAIEELEAEAIGTRHLEAALDELLEGSAPVVRTLLGAGEQNLDSVATGEPLDHARPTDQLRPQTGEPHVTYDESDE